MRAEATLARIEAAGKVYAAISAACLGVDIYRGTLGALGVLIAATLALQLAVAVRDAYRRRKWTHTCGWCLGDLRQPMADGKTHCEQRGGIGAPPCSHADGMGCAPLHNHGFPGSPECPPPIAVGIGLPGGWAEARYVQPDETWKPMGAP